ncbi:MAG: hypothetical protein Q4P23_07595 [Micrococcaceae bacterium]|nr:hypothetical protein [Micrococcaceae bacterium]
MSDETGPALSRRALRERRRAETEAKLAQEPADTGTDPVSPVPPEAATKSVPAPAKSPKPVADPAAKAVARPGAKSPAAKPAPAQDPAPVAKPVPVVGEAVRSRRAAASEVDAVPERTERTSLQRARDREALRARRRLEQEVSSLSAKEQKPAEDPAPLTRKQMRLQALDALKESVKAPSRDSAPKQADEASSAEAAQMSVEEALALRRSSGAGSPSEPLLLKPEEDLAEVDLEVLAQQRELAARAAIISRRAAERLRLQEENTQREGARRSDPFTGAMNNLVADDVEKKMVNTGISGPLTRGYNIAMTDQGTLHGGAQPATPAAPTTQASAPAAPKPATPGAKAPAVTPAKTPKAATPAQAPAAGTKPSDAKEAAAAAPPKAQLERKAAGTPDTADPHADDELSAAARPPVRAVRAQGLDPLDVQTAGMRRANNMYLMVIAALSVGGAALVAGLIMFLNSN